MADKYPDAQFVWLRRDFDAVAASFARLDAGSWMCRFWEFFPSVEPLDPVEAARIAIDEHTAMCHRSYCQLPPGRRREMWIETIKPPFAKLWHDIGAEGDLAAALATFDTPINTSDQREGLA